LIAAEGNFNTKRFDFVETSLITEPHETMDDVVEKKIFKYKYRICNDEPDIYERRQRRMVSRFEERAKTRDSALEQNLFDLY
jgi:hypothetical protein